MIKCFENGWYMNKWVTYKQKLGFRENSMLYTFKCDRHTELEVIYFYNCVEFIILYSLWNILIWIPLHNENQRPWTFLSKAYFVFTRITISYYIYMHQHIEAGAKWHFQTFWIAFSWMKMYYFRVKFHWHLLPSVQLTTFQHWCR